MASKENKENIFFIYFLGPTRIHLAPTFFIYNGKSGIT